MKEKILNWMMVIVFGVFIGTVLMTLSYLINGEGLAKNLQKSQTQMKLQSEYQKVDDFPNSTLDNFTDSLMILTAGYQEENGVLKDAMNNPRLTTKGKSPYGTLTGSLTGENVTTTTYARYWHGYLIFLRPLLSIFNYSQIRTLNAMVQGALLLILIIKMYKKKLGYCILPFLSAYLLINPLTIASSLQYSTVWYLVLISMLVYLIFQEKIIKNKLHHLFFTLIGMLTSYFDLLTYPIATLGMVLILVLVAEELNWKEAIKRVLVCGASWTFGYGVMWLAKWIIASIILNENVFNSANEAIQSRSSNVLNSGREISRTEGFERIFSKFDSSITKWTVRINLIVCIAGFVVSKIKKKLIARSLADDEKKKQLKKVNKLPSLIRNVLKCILNVLPVLAIALMPILWYVVLANHSYIHAFFSFRTAVVLWFAIFMAAFKLIRDLKKI